MSNASDQSTSQGAALGNGIPPTIQGVFEDGLIDEVVPLCSEEQGENKTQLMTQIERDLDSLTYSGSSINDLEIQLTRRKELYKKTLIECRLHVDTLARKLGTHIKKSEPFIELWRKARQVQDASNKAAARYDKANNQYAAAKEMIRMAEAQLAVRKAEQENEQDPSSPSPIDLAWQEMLNHATLKVVATEKERRESEVEHLKIMEQCTSVMEKYRATERRLRSHINKSKPFYQERYRANQRLLHIKQHIQALERKIEEAKKAYSSTLKRLETLNTEIHQRRQSLAVTHLAPRRIYATSSNPELRRVAMGHCAASDTESLDSLQLDNGIHFTGSTGSLPSIGTSSISRSPTPDIRTNSPSPDGFNPVIISRHRDSSPVGGHRDEPLLNTHGESPLIASVAPPPSNRTELPPTPPQSIEFLASELVQRTLTAVVSKLQQEHSTQHD